MRTRHWISLAATAIAIATIIVVVLLVAGPDTSTLATSTSTITQPSSTTTIPPSTTAARDDSTRPVDPQPSVVTTAVPDPPDRNGEPASSTPPVGEGTTPEGFDVSDWIAVYENPSNGGASILSGIRIVHPDGTGLRHDFGNGVENGVGMMPDWSPDGTRLAVARRPVGLRQTVGSDQLFEADLVARSTRPLFACADPCISDQYPAYSPDGSQMAFTRLTGHYRRQEESDGSGSSTFVPGTCGIWIGSLASLHVEQVTSDPACITTSPRWSPTGGKLVYASAEGADNTTRRAIFVIDLTTRDITQLTDFDLDGADPDWSPDGEWIVFGTHPSQWWDPTDMIGGGLYRIRPDGTDLQQLPSSDASVRGASRPRYTPDGQWITYAYGNDIWVIPSAGGNAIRLITSGRYSQADWQP